MLKQRLAQKIIHEITGKGDEISFNGHGKCTLEIGGDMAGIGAGDFYAEPTPIVVLQEPTKANHQGKVNYEKFWLSEWFENKK
jgi:sulfide:quinone oxidoreductase